MEFETKVQKTVKAKGRGTDITISISLNPIHDLNTLALSRIIYFGSHSFTLDSSVITFDFGFKGFNEK